MSNHGSRPVHRRNYTRRQIHHLVLPCIAANLDPHADAKRAGFRVRDSDGRSVSHERDCKAVNMHERVGCMKR